MKMEVGISSDSKLKRVNSSTIVCFIFIMTTLNTNANAAGRRVESQPESKRKRVLFKRRKSSFIGD